MNFNHHYYKYTLMELLQKGISHVLKQDLLNVIEKKREELIKIAVTNGLRSSVAIRYSQELDNLINIYNRIYLN